MNNTSAVVIGCTTALIVVGLPLVLLLVSRIKKTKAPTKAQIHIKSIMPWVLFASVVLGVFVAVRLYGTGTQHHLNVVGPFLFFPVIMYVFTVNFGDLPEDRSRYTAQRVAVATFALVVLWVFRFELSLIIHSLGLSLSDNTTNLSVIRASKYALIAAGLVVVYRGVLAGKVLQNTVAANILFILWVMTN